MQKIPIITKDGSHTLSIPGMGVTYHSIHGAVTESLHVYIRAGLEFRLSLPYTSPLRILEMGFGTGLNVFLSFLAAREKNTCIHYTAVEAFPLDTLIVSQMDYPAHLHKEESRDIFNRIQDGEWNKPLNISPGFLLEKKEQMFEDFLNGNPGPFDLIYYDAFAPRAQPELWTAEIFEKIYRITNANGILVTYCSKSEIRRALQKTGFLVTKLQGPRGKREMVRAVK